MGYNDSNKQRRGGSRRPMTREERIANDFFARPKRSSRHSNQRQFGGTTGPVKNSGVISCRVFSSPKEWAQARKDAHNFLKHDPAHRRRGWKTGNFITQDELRGMASAGTDGGKQPVGWDGGEWGSTNFGYSLERSNPHTGKPILDRHGNPTYASPSYTPYDHKTQVATNWLACNTDILASVNPVGNHGRAYHDYNSPSKKEKLQTRGQRRQDFALALKKFTSKMLVRDAKVILGAVKRNIKTLQRSRNPFGRYVTQRKDSHWKDCFKYELVYKRANGVAQEALIGLDQFKKFPAAAAFEFGGKIYWSGAHLWRDRNATEKRRIIKRFLSLSPTVRLAIKRRKKSDLAHLELDPLSGKKQPYMRALLEVVKPLEQKKIESEFTRFFKNKRTKSVSSSKYSFLKKSQMEVSGMLQISPRKVLTNLASRGSGTFFRTGLLDMTQKELAAFCKKQNALNKNRRNVRRGSIPNLTLKQMRGVIDRVKYPTIGKHTGHFKKFAPDKLQHKKYYKK